MKKFQSNAHKLKKKKKRSKTFTTLFMQCKCTPEMSCLCVHFTEIWFVVMTIEIDWQYFIANVSRMAKTEQNKDVCFQTLYWRINFFPDVRIKIDRIL